MMRFVLIAGIILLAWFVVMQAWRYFRTGSWDWKGMAFIVGFIALAFVLRHITSMG